MPWAKTAEIDSLRMKYNADLAAHRDRIRSLAEAHAQGVVPSQDLIEAQANARLDLDLCASSRIRRSGAKHLSAANG